MSSTPPRSPLDWTNHGNGSWTAYGPTDTHWEIADTVRGGSLRYEITVAHGDRGDWWASSLKAAKDLAAEIERAPADPRARAGPGTELRGRHTR